jgi:hypothetical protein
LFLKRLTRSCPPPQILADQWAAHLLHLISSLACQSVQLQVDFSKIAASSVVEFGEILPEPGEEGPWLEKMKLELKKS